MSVRSIILTLLLAAGPASAQEAIPTAARAPEGGAPIAQPSGTLTIPEIRDEFADGPRRVNGCGVPVDRDGKLDKRVHGEVFGGIGTHGYREAGGAACVPLGDRAAATIAIDAGTYGRRR